MPSPQTTTRIFWLLLGVLALAACQPSPANLQATIDAQVAIAVAATQSALPTATAYAANTALPSPIPLATATAFPAQPALPTATQYPTATAYPTSTPVPTSTPAPTNTPALIPPTAVPTSSAATGTGSGAGSAPASPVQTQISLLENMTLLHNLMIEFQGSVGSLNNHGSPDCNRLIQIFDTVQALPQMDITGTDLTVQQAYSAYRSAIDHFTKPENPPIDVATLCKTQPENLANIPGMQINAIVLYIEQSDNLMENAWRAIGGR